jgi:uncharacterized membrane protein YdbT with pleckstrin-like domain
MSGVRELMGRYVQDTLIPGERVMHETHLHWIIYAAGGVFTALAFVTAGVTLVIAIPVLIYAWINARTSEFCVTDGRVLIKTGWLSRRTIELNISKVESLEVSQGMLGRSLNYGTIIVVGTGSTREPFRRIADPLGFRRAVQAQQS